MGLTISNRSQYFRKRPFPGIGRVKNVTQWCCFSCTFSITFCSGTDSGKRISDECQNSKQQRKRQ